MNAATETRCPKTNSESGHHDWWNGKCRKCGADFAKTYKEKAKSKAARRKAKAKPEEDPAPGGNIITAPGIFSTHPAADRCPHCGQPMPSK